jgi:hypothetical protein
MMDQYLIAKERCNGAGRVNAMISMGSSPTLRIIVNIGNPAIEKTLVKDMGLIY